MTVKAPETLLLYDAIEGPFQNYSWILGILKIDWNENSSIEGCKSVMSCLLALSLSLFIYFIWNVKKNLYEKYIYQFWLDTKLAQPLFFCQNLELYILHEMHTGYQFHHLRIAWGPTPTLIWDKFEPMLLKNCKDTLWINSWLLTIGSNLTHARSTPPPLPTFLKSTYISHTDKCLFFFYNV